MRRLRRIVDKDRKRVARAYMTAVANTKGSVTGVCPAGDALDFTVNASSLVEVLVSDGKFAHCQIYLGELSIR
ncbi:hypothetical protein CA14_007287 [Aspergillus flavus]|uniref:Uncharacterized protein n=1 Tax=Aspergillus flavus TaxID=5059 RepID=A0AB74C8K3_ASPFL|nr:hypothetical protein CA14_007287 [Aspergillus flavus]